MTEILGINVLIGVISLVAFMFFGVRVNKNAEENKSIFVTSGIFGVATCLMACLMPVINDITAGTFLLLLLLEFVVFATFMHVSGENIPEIIAFIVAMCMIGILIHDVVLMKLGAYSVFTPITITVVVIVTAAEVVKTALEHRSHEDSGKVAYLATAIVAIITAVAVIIVAWAMWAGAKADGPQTDTSVEVEVEPTGTPAPTAEPDDAIVERLTVTKEDLEEAAIESLFGDISRKLLTSSMSVCDKKRVKEAGDITDALTRPFKAKVTADMIGELYREILRNPIYGVTVARALADKKICGVKFKKINPWVKDLTKDHELVYWLEKDKDDNFFVTEEYRRLAAGLCIFLNRLVEQGVQERRVGENWCLNNAAFDNDREGIIASYVYTKEALVLAYIDKAGEERFVIGFNIHDKRPEFFEKPKNPVPTATPKGKSTATPKPSATPTGSKSTATPKPTATPTGSKSTAKPSPTPTSKPTPTPKRYNKNPNLAPGGDTELNSDPGTGAGTNNGVGVNTSSADSEYNSQNSSLTDNGKEQEKQKERDGSDTPTVTAAPSVTVDDKSGGEVDEPTATKAPATTGGKPIDGSDGGEYTKPTPTPKPKSTSKQAATTTASNMTTPGLVLSSFATLTTPTVVFKNDRWMIIG